MWPWPCTHRFFFFPLLCAYLFSLLHCSFSFLRVVVVAVVVVYSCTFYFYSSKLMIMNVLPIGIQRVSITDSKRNIVYVVFLRMFLDSNSVLLLFAARSFFLYLLVLLRVCFVCCCTFVRLFFILSCKSSMPMQPRCLNKLAETIFKMNNTSGWARCSILLLCFSLSLSLCLSLCLSSSVRNRLSLLALNE